MCVCKQIILSCMLLSTKCMYCAESKTVTVYCLNDSPSSVAHHDHVNYATFAHQNRAKNHSESIITSVTTKFSKYYLNGLINMLRLIFIALQIPILLISYDLAMPHVGITLAKQGLKMAQWLSAEKRREHSGMNMPDKAFRIFKLTLAECTIKILWIPLNFAQDYHWNYRDTIAKVAMKAGKAICGERAFKIFLKDRSSLSRYCTNRYWDEYIREYSIMKLNCSVIDDDS